MKTEIEVLHVYVSSESPIKHNAVRRAFDRMGLRTETTGFSVESGVRAQPLTIEETHDGAIRRHEELCRLLGKKAGYRVTVESGVVKPFPNSPWTGCEVAIVEKQPDGLRMMSIDLGVEYPPKMMKKILSGEYPDLGVLLQTEYGYTEKDPPSYLTDGRLPRADLIEQAVFKVLAQMGSRII